MQNSTLALIVVLYHPEKAHIDRIKKLSQRYEVIAVDNTPAPADYAFTQETTLVSLKDNVGIAAALNIGIMQAKKNHQFALLLDQDSDPETNLIDGLMAFYRHQEQYDDIALVAPCYYEKRLKKRSHFIQKGKVTMLKTIPSGESAVDISYIITSGSLLNLSCYDHIGPMKEDLFIDFVDIEWCLRAKSKHYRILGLPWLKMEHEIGEPPVKFLGKEYVSHTPIRHYYYFRNVFILLRMPYVPWQWKAAELLKLLPRFVVFATATSNKSKHIRHMLSGVMDGLKKKYGKKRK